MQRLTLCLTALLALLCTCSPAKAQTSTLAQVRAANALSCGVNFEEAEYSILDAHGNHSLFALDLCKAVAVAVLGPGAKFNVVPYRAEKDALEGLKAGKIAVLATASANLINSADPALTLSRPVFYDYQGLLVNKAQGIARPADLAGKKTCFLGDTEQQQQVQGYMDREKIKWLPFPFSEEGEMEAALITGNCAAVTADVSQLAYERIAFKGMAAQFVILPDVLAKDPLAMATRSADRQWAAIVDWVAEALIQAEESNITRANLAANLPAALAAAKASDDPVTTRLLGTQKGWAQFLGLDDAWAANMIAAVGNYGELFNRDLGSASVMKLDRGPNSLWTHGGLMMALPMR